MTRTAALLLLRLRQYRTQLRPLAETLRVWGFGALIGVAGGYAVLGFRFVIDHVAILLYGVDETLLASAGHALPAWRVILAPIVGGLVVSSALLTARRFGWLPEGRPQGITEVIESRAITGVQIDLKAGAASAAISAVSLGSGASAGREGPAVHLCASIAQAVTNLVGLRARDARTLLGCGAAAAVSASFNAPIAGVLFALEVVLGNYALSIFGPVTLASVVAAVIVRSHIGDSPAFFVPPYAPASPADVPFAAAFGVIAGLTALAFLLSTSRLTRWVGELCRRTKTPAEAAPVFAGVVIGGIGVFYPEVLSVGYEATQNALQNEYGIRLLTILLILKIFATAITLSCRFGGGVFSTGVYLGAVSGAAYGLVLSRVFEGFVAEPTFYAMVGIGAVAGAILGAPISTTLVVFELTRDYQMTIALLAAVSVATLITQSVFGRSYFHWQLSRRGYDLSDGPQGVVLQTTRVRDVMMRLPDADEPLSEDAPRLLVTTNLGDALAAMEEADKPGLPVVGLDDDAMPIGYLSRVKALAAYNKALIDLHVEHHR